MQKLQCECPYLLLPFSIDEFRARVCGLPECTLSNILPYDIMYNLLSSAVLYACRAKCNNTYEAEEVWYYMQRKTATGAQSHSNSTGSFIMIDEH
eukprot:16314-Heterococcus_DN1.PRE.1